jgi:hypothetical protein
MTLGISIESHNAECRIFFFMLSVGEPIRGHACVTKSTNKPQIAQWYIVKVIFLKIDITVSGNSDMMNWMMILRSNIKLGLKYKRQFKTILGEMVNLPKSTQS